MAVARNDKGRVFYDSTEKTKSFNAEAQRRKENQKVDKDLFSQIKASILKNIEASFKNLCAFASLR